MYNDMLNSDAGKERVQQFINEAEEARRVRQYDNANPENSVFAQLRKGLVNAWNNTMTRTTPVTKTNNQPVKNSL